VTLAGLLAGGILAWKLTLSGASDTLIRSLGYREPKRISDGYAPGALPEDTYDALIGESSHDPPMSAEPGPSPEATPSGEGPGERLRVANTDGLGVVLASAPRQGARTPRGLREGTRVTLLQRAGDEWALVRADHGLDGWIPTHYLASAE
jgi:SH3 domain-containing protein